jgi:CheY-like chemotaxis protein
VFPSGTHHRELFGFHQGFENAMKRQDAKSRQYATLLVVDSNPISLLGTAGVLDSHGYECFCARNAEAALQVPAQTSLDAAIVDVSDDAEASLQLIADLRTACDTPELPVILLAAADWAGLEKRCETLPSVRCLFKPIDPNALCDIVQQSLWLPQVTSAHRRRGIRPNRPGWVEL